MQTFAEIVSGELLRWGLNAEGVAKYSDVKHVETIWFVFRVVDTAYLMTDIV